MRITWLGHATAVLDVDGRRVVTDPLLRRHALPLLRAWPQPVREHWQHPDAVLLSHLHYDHTDLPSLRLLRHGSGDAPGEVPVVTAPAVARWLERRGVPGAVGAAVGERVQLPGGLEVVPVRAVHESRPLPGRPTDAIGHLVDTARHSVWFTGDTALHDDLAGLPQLSRHGRVDVALVAVGGWGPRLSEGHMGPEEAARACALVGARVAVPVHWGTFHLPGLSRLPPGWMRRAGPEFVEALGRLAPGCRAVLLEPGQGTDVHLAGTPSGPAGAPNSLT